MLVAGRYRVGSGLLAVAFAISLWSSVATAQSVPPAPDPEELCAALEGQPGYEECLATTADALDDVTVPAAPGVSVEVPDADEPTGAELSEESLDEQQKVLYVIVAVVLVGMFLVVILSWRRSMKRMRAAFSPEALALMESLIPPEVRAVNPDATVRDGLTDKERKLLRGQRNLITVLLFVPVVAFVGLQVWEPSIETSVAIGEVARYLPLVLAIPAIIWARRRIGKALEAGEDRWEVLGLKPESGPDVILVPRFTGGLQGMVVGDTVISGVRYGRNVRIEMGSGSVRTSVYVPGMPERPAVDENGATLWAAGGWVVLERKISGATLAGPDGLITLMRDLQRAEQVAGGVVPA